MLPAYRYHNAARLGFTHANPVRDIRSDHGRNAVAVLIAIEIMLNSVNLALVGMSRYVGERGLVAGQIFAVFIITVAAAEAAVALAMLIAIYRARGTINIDDINLMRW